MSFFERLFKREREQQAKGDKLNIKLKTKIYLSKEERDAITEMVKEDIEGGYDIDVIGIHLIMSGVTDNPVCITRTRNGIRVKL